MNREAFGLSSRRYYRDSYRDTEISHRSDIVVRAVYLTYVESGMFVSDRSYIIYEQKRPLWTAKKSHNVQVRILE